MSLQAGGAAPAPPAPPIKTRCSVGRMSGAAKNVAAPAMRLPQSSARPASDRWSVRLGRARRPAFALHAAGRYRRYARIGQNARLPARMASRAPLLLTGARVILGAARPASARPPQVQKHSSSFRPSLPHAARHGAARRPHRNGKTKPAHTGNREAQSTAHANPVGRGLHRRNANGKTVRAKTDSPSDGGGLSVFANPNPNPDHNP